MEKLPRVKRNVQSGTLYLVGTPIGNLGDISFRAVETLKSVALIAAEDTRRTGLLCQRYEIDKPMTSLHEHNEREKTAHLLDQLRNGDSIALVSDAGMPVLSDPGAYLVEQAHAAGIPVTSIPGPSAAVMTLALSGFRGEKFRFEGFPPKKQKALEEWLKKMGQEEVPVICYESPYRLKKTLKAIQKILGEIPVVVGRELTKKYEEITSGSTAAALKRYTELPPKGECTLIFYPQKNEHIDDPSNSSY